jgi:hypothetical protein
MLHTGDNDRLALDGSHVFVLESKFGGHDCI